MTTLLEFATQGIPGQSIVTREIDNLDVAPVIADLLLFGHEFHYEQTPRGTANITVWERDSETLIHSSDIAYQKRTGESAE